MSEKLELANRIRRARERAGLSQGQAAKKLDWHRPTISEIEAGRRSVKASELQVFSKLYGVDSNWLISGESSESAPDEDILAAARELSSMNEEDLEALVSAIKMIKSQGKGIEKS